MEGLEPGLYLVPTPIGNLEDITLRSLRVLKSVDVIAAEDTRHTGLLLNHYQIRRPLVALHQHNEHHRTASLLAQVAENGQRLAIVTDAGTPGISDPGFFIVREALSLGLRVEALPGPTAFVPALAASGLPLDRFVFEGFLPVKKGRATRLLALAEEPRTMVFYESPFRVIKTLVEFASLFGDARLAVAARELTKLHEEIIRGSLSELLAHFTEKSPRGEFVLIVAGREK